MLVVCVACSWFARGAFGLVVCVCVCVCVCGVVAVCSWCARGVLVVFDSFLFDSWASAVACLWCARVRGLCDSLVVCSCSYVM